MAPGLGFPGAREGAANAGPAFGLDDEELGDVAGRALGLGDIDRRRLDGEGGPADRAAGPEAGLVELRAKKEGQRRRLVGRRRPTQRAKKQLALVS